MVINKKYKKLLMQLLKGFSKIHTITSLAHELKMSRVGIWKIIKQLESESYLTVTKIGSGKTSTSIVKLNWENVLVEKSLALYLTAEALGQKRWQINFSNLKKEADFIILFGSILHSQKEANDIDIIIISKKTRFIKIQKLIENIQKIEIRKIHNINFTEKEFLEELEKQNITIIEAVKKGIVLYGQENYIEFMKKVLK